MSEKIKVIYVEPKKEPKVIEIEDTLVKMQELVGGYIEEYMPFKDDIALICNEEGKNCGLTPNRYIYDDEGNLLDIIAGSFFLAGAPAESENFESLSDDMVNKYMDIFKLEG